MKMLCYLDGTLCEMVSLSKVVSITLNKSNSRFIVVVKSSDGYRGLICSDLEIQEDLCIEDVQ